MEFLASVDFWVAVGQIILIDILLGGDNAVVIALACRRLPPDLRAKGVFWGTVGAIVLRLVLIFFALQLLAVPFLKIAGAVLLVWIGVKLLLPEHEEGHGEIAANDKLWGAVKTVIVADFVMSVDNVIAIAGAAETSGTGHSFALVIFGVLVSIPIIVWGSQLVLRLMDRFPIIITIGGMLLGWIAGSMVVSDPVFSSAEVMPSAPKFAATDLVRYGAGTVGALLVLALGTLLARRQETRRDARAQARPSAGVAKASGQMRKMVLAVDGSAGSDAALRHLVAMRNELRDPTELELHLVNVQRPVSGDVTTFISGKVLDEYHTEKSVTATARARETLTQAGLPFTVHMKVGAPGSSIAEIARVLGADLIVLGSRGLGNNTGARLGSVAASTLEHADVPVLVVNAAPAA